MRTLFTTLTLATGIAMLSVAPVSAGSRVSSRSSTGLENIHTLKRERGKLCMVGHYHSGVGYSNKSKADALRKARHKWFAFVDLEYGPAWSHWSLAANKGVKCTKDYGRYRCSLEGRPCRR